MVAYLEAGRTINGAYYAKELRGCIRRLWRKEEES